MEGHGPPRGCTFCSDGSCSMCLEDSEQTQDHITDLDEKISTLRVLFGSNVDDDDLLEYLQRANGNLDKCVESLQNYEPKSKIQKKEIAWGFPLPPPPPSSFFSTLIAHFQKTQSPVPYSQFSDIPIPPPPIANKHSSNIDLPKNWNNQKLKEIPPRIWTVPANRVTSLLLQSNEITMIPSDIRHLHSLRILDIDSNKLTNLPKEIGFLRSLETLSANNNQITEIPLEIGSLEKLTYLYLNNNRISVIPMEIKGCTQLKTFHIALNCLEQLPVTLAECYNLKELSVMNNQKTWKFPPKVVIDSGFSLIMEVLSMFNRSVIMVNPPSLEVDLKASFLKRDWADVKFEISSAEKPIYAHRIILISRCPRFASLFHTELREETIVLNVDYMSFCMMMEYLYTGSLIFPPDITVTKLLFEEYGLDHVFERRLKDALAYTDDLGIVGQNIYSTCFNSPLLSDVTFLVENRPFYAHRFILQLRSERFKAMFGLGLKESQLDTIPIEDISYPIFEMLMEYLYSDTVHNIEADKAVDLLLCANQYGVERLQQICEREIDQFLDYENAAGLFELTDRLQCTQLRGSCLYFLRENLDVVKKILNLDDYLPDELQKELQVSNVKSPSSYEYQYNIDEQRKKVEARLTGKKLD